MAGERVAKVPQGPRGNRMHGPRPKLKKGTFKRMMRYFKKYTLQMILVFICIVFSSLAGVEGSKFMQTLIDDVINPALKSGSIELNGALGAFIRIGICISGHNENSER